MKLIYLTNMGLHLEKFLIKFLVLVFFEDFILTLYCDAYKVERLIKFIHFTENYKTELFHLSNSILLSEILITKKKIFKMNLLTKIHLI